MIRVLIADDSMLTRVVLRDLLAQDPEIEIIAEVQDGLQAVAETCRLRPDLIIMDIMMPVMDGLDAVTEIMATCATPILVLSANVDATHSRSAFNAIRLGALDVMEKPHGVITEAFGEVAARLVERVKALARVRVIHHFRRKTQPVTTVPQMSPGVRRILAIGASTGGPKMVMRLMKELPATLDVRILIVQHIAPGFAEGFAEWLDRESAFKIRTARHGDSLEKGVALVAPSHVHMEVRNDKVVILDTPPVNCCRPAVDVLFQSLAVPGVGAQVAGVLLTGMGRDGAEGMAALKRQGAYNIAQDESTSVVFGMPRAAIELNAVHQTLAIGEMAAALTKLFR